MTRSRSGSITAPASANRDGEAAAFGAITTPGGISYTADPFGNANAAMTIATGSTLSTAFSSPNPNGDFPVGNMDGSLTAWVKCSAFASPAQSTVVEWGAPGIAASVQKLSLSVQGPPVSPAVAPGVIPRWSRA